MSWAIVTPARNEAARLSRLASSLAAQTPGLVALWVVVDDGSTDDTASLAEGLDPGAPVVVLRRDNHGGLESASEWEAFLVGASLALDQEPSVSRVMKCDADMELASDYLDQFIGIGNDVGVCAGVIQGRAEREQRGYTTGALKSYSREAIAILRADMPPVLGWDVADEIYLRLRGLRSTVVPAAVARSNRRTGSSEGLLAGRRRNGRLSRWLGYHPLYFCLRLTRFAFRKPLGVGALAVLQGYLSAGPSPFADDVRAEFRGDQVRKLRALARNPARWLRDTYG